MAFPPTDWLDWTTAEYEVGAPATSLSFERWFRNPVALAQGAPGAPKVQGIALGGMDGGVFSMASTGSTTGGSNAITDLDLVKTVLIFGELFSAPLGGSPSVPAPQLGYRLSADNGSSWGSPVYVAGANATQGAFGDNISLTAISVVDMTSSNAIQLYFAETGSSRIRTIRGGLVILGGV